MKLERKEEEMGKLSSQKYELIQANSSPPQATLCFQTKTHARSEASETQYPTCPLLDSKVSALIHMGVHSQHYPVWPQKGRGEKWKPSPQLHGAWSESGSSFICHQYYSWLISATRKFLYGLLTGGKQHYLLPKQKMVNLSSQLQIRKWKAAAFNGDPFIWEQDPEPVFSQINCIKVPSLDLI